MKSLSRFIFLLALTPLSARAVLITVDAGLLSNFNGSSAMPSTGLVVLTAARDGGAFRGPSGTSFTTGDEIEIARWDLSALGDGLLSAITGNLAFSDFSSPDFTWDQGDPLGLYWYPSLTLGAGSLLPGTQYGFYSDASGIDGSDPWRTPAEAEAISLHFFTADIGGSTIDPEAGWARHEVPGAGGPAASEVPDSGNTLLLMGVGLAGLAAVRRFGLPYRKS